MTCDLHDRKECTYSSIICGCDYRKARIRHFYTSLNNQNSLTDYSRVVSDVYTDLVGCIVGKSV